MTSHYNVYLTPDAIADLMGIYDYIADDSQLPEVAMGYVRKLRRKCEDLCLFPLRGTSREDIRENLRIYPLDKSSVVAFEVDEALRTVTILNIFYGGQDYEVIMLEG